MCYLSLQKKHVEGLPDLVHIGIWELLTRHTREILAGAEIRQSPRGPTVMH